MIAELVNISIISRWVMVLMTIVTKAKLVNIPPITMVYDFHNYTIPGA